MTEPWGTFRTM